MRGMGFLKGQVLSPKFTTAEITDADDNIYYVPIKHTINNFFLVEIDNKFFAFTLKGARRLTHRSKSGIGKSFQVIQYDTTHYSSINPTTVQLGQMLKENSLGKMNLQMHNILSVLARREKASFGMWMVGKEIFETEDEAIQYLNGLEDKTITVFDKNNKETKEALVVRHDIHSIDDLAKIFEEEKGEFPEQVKEIKNYLKSLDVKNIVSSLRPITDFVTEDLIATDSGYLGEAIARYQRADGTFREITNVPVKPKGNMMKYLIIGFVVMIIVLGAYALNESGSLDGLFEFTDNLGTIQEGFKDSGLGSIGSIQTKSTGGVAYTDASLQSKYPDCDSFDAAIQSGELDYNKLSASMKTLVDSC